MVDLEPQLADDSQDDFDQTDRSHAEQVARWLEGYRKLLRQGKRLSEIVAEQRAVADGLTGVDYSKANVTTSPTADQVHNAAVRHMELAELVDEIAASAGTRAEKMLAAIMAVSDIDGQNALLGHYVEGRSWEQLCVDEACSYRTMMRRRHRALVEIYERDLIPHTERYPRQPAV